MSSTTDNTCVVCFKNVEIYSIGICDHPVCHECSTRMRVLCLQNECPICRRDLPKVIFTKTIQPFKEICGQPYSCDKQFKICFESVAIENTYQKLLSHECRACKNGKPYTTFSQLKEHLRKDHELFFCDLCVDNLKIFTHERMVYSRKGLALHRRKGDPDDKSHKGHPLCEFCDQRYMDRDELFRHLRKDHLFCHFCDADGSDLHPYYSSYNYLRDHFRKEHFLCEEGSCIGEQFTTAFRSEIDLKAHKASQHSRSMGKAATKQARTLELEFAFAPRPRGERSDRNHRDNDRGALTGTRNSVHIQSHECNHAGACNCQPNDYGTVGGIEISTSSRPLPQMVGEVRLKPEDFPTLGGNVSTSSAPVLPLQASGRGGSTGVTISSSRGFRKTLTMNDENFPALAGAAPQSHKVWLSVNSRSERPTNSSANFSIFVNSRPRGSTSTSNPSNHVTRSMSIQNPPSVREESDFPALRPLDSYKGTTADSWTSSASALEIGPSQVQSKVKLVSSNCSAQPVAKSSPRPSPKSFVMDQDFPTLAVPQPVASKTTVLNKKASSVTIPISNSWTKSSRDESPAKSSDSESIPNFAIGTKSKKKKKKTKGNDTSKQPIDNNKILAEQTPSSTNSVSGKKKKKESLKSQSQLKEKASENTDNNLNETGVANQENRAPAEESSQTVNDRKRSELRIDSLHVNNSVNTGADTTDRLISILKGENQVPNSTMPTPPPGFEKKTVGAEKVAGPPPGFTVKVNSVARVQSNDLTFTNSSGESYPILPSRVNYIQPPDFSKRNRALMEEVVNSLGDEDRQEFQQKSILFRQGKLSAESYFNHCLEIMGEGTFNRIFPEMLVLLPDIFRQQELLKVFTNSNFGERKQNFETCATCSQVLAPSDLRFHLSAHTLENHFPILTNSNAAASSAWGKK